MESTLNRKTTIQERIVAEATTTFTDEVTYREEVSTEQQHSSWLSQFTSSSTPSKVGFSTPNIRQSTAFKRSPYNLRSSSKFKDGQDGRLEDHIFQDLSRSVLSEEEDEFQSNLSVESSFYSDDELDDSKFSPSVKIRYHPQWSDMRERRRIWYLNRRTPGRTLVKKSKWILLKKYISHTVIVRYILKILVSVTSLIQSYTFHSNQYSFSHTEKNTSSWNIFKMFASMTKRLITFIFYPYTLVAHILRKTIFTNNLKRQIQAKVIDDGDGLSTSSTCDSDSAKKSTVKRYNIFRL